MNWPPGAGDRTLVGAHRGARAAAPENTLLAARRAVELEADFWELDVRLTRDGVPVVIHDRSLVRTTDAGVRFPDRAPWHVDRFAADEIAVLDAGSWFLAADPFGTVAGLEAGAAAACRSQRVPTLEQALTFSLEHGLPANVEIKGIQQTGVSADVVVDAVAGAIERTGSSALVLISSINHDYLRSMRKRLPSIPLAALFKDTLPDDLPGYLNGLGAVACHLHQALVRKGLIQSLAAAGFEVNVWTVNAEARARALIADGANALFTDFPERVRALLPR